MSIKDIVARLNDKSIVAAEGDKSDTALKYFENIFGKGKRNEAGDTITYTFKDMNPGGGRKVSAVSFEIYEDGYEFSCKIETPFIKSMMPDDSFLMLEHDTAAGLVAEFKKRITALMDEQHKDVDEDKKNLDFLRKLDH